MCRRFIWAGNDEKSKRAPVAWDHVCDSIANGGRNIIALGEWNKATIGKLLWSLSEKKDKMWVKWMHSYYLKNRGMEEYQPNNNSSWLMKSICKHKAELMSNDIGMNSRPMICITLEECISICDRLQTKDRLMRHGTYTDGNCLFCNMQENRGHLFLSVRSQRRFGRRLSIGLGWSISILIGMSILLGNKLKGRATKCAFSKLRWLKRFTTFGG
ncbi:hypothetical protein KIW84_UN0004 [Lathyrus oleraceus]|nr:hypothetical protein KIW84_UN0004 [Pisum sativum]